MISVNFSNIAILNIKGSDCRCIISLISKNEAINLLQNADLNEETGSLQIKTITKISKAYIKMEKTIIKFGDIEFQNKNFTIIKNLFQ